MFFVSSICAIETKIPAPVDSTTIVQTIKHVVEFEPPKTSEFRFDYNNILESLTEEQINRIVTTLEESGDVSAETFNVLTGTLLTLNALLEDKSFMANKVIYQAQEHYDLSESEVKRSQRKDQRMILIIYGAMLFCLIYALLEIPKIFPKQSGLININLLVSTLLELTLELFALWYILRPGLSIIFNRDFEIIKFLLQGS